MKKTVFVMMIIIITAIATATACNAAGGGVAVVAEIPDWAYAYAKVLNEAWVAEDVVDGSSARIIDIDCDGTPELVRGGWWGDGGGYIYKIYSYIDGKLILKYDLQYYYETSEETFCELYMAKDKDGNIVCIGIDDISHANGPFNGNIFIVENDTNEDGEPIFRGKTVFKSHLYYSPVEILYYDEEYNSLIEDFLESQQALYRKVKGFYGKEIENYREFRIGFSVLHPEDFTILENPDTLAAELAKGY